MPIWIMPWVAIVLVLLGIMSVACSRRRRLGPPACRACGYSMLGLATEANESAKCPECGYEGAVRAFRPRRFRRSRIVGGAALLILATIAWHLPLLVQVDYPKRTPTWLLTRLPFDRVGWADQQLAGKSSRSRWLKELNERLAVCAEDEWNNWLRRVAVSVNASGPEAILDDGTRIWLRLVDVSDLITPSEAQIESVPTYLGFGCGNGFVEGWERPHGNKAVHARAAIRARLAQALNDEIRGVDEQHGFVVGCIDGWFLIRASPAGHQKVQDRISSDVTFSTAVSASSIRSYLDTSLDLRTFRNRLRESNVASFRTLRVLSEIREPVVRKPWESRESGR